MLNSESVVSVKPGDSGVVIEYHIGKFACTSQWSASFHDHTFTLILWESY